MDNILISIKPKYCKQIISGEKTFEIRKTKPNCEVPFKCYIYCTKDKSESENVSENIIGEFICDKIIGVDCDSVELFDVETKDYIGDKCCLTREEFSKYTNFKTAYGWHISELKVYESAKDLSTAILKCVTEEMPYCPTCKYGYIEVVDEDTYLYENGGETKWHCLNRIRKPPQSYCYIDGLEE